MLRSCICCWTDYSVGLLAILRSNAQGLLCFPEWWGSAGVSSGAAPVVAVGLEDGAAPALNQLAGHAAVGGQLVRQLGQEHDDVPQLALLQLLLLALGSSQSSSRQHGQMEPTARRHAHQLSNGYCPMWR